MKTTMRNDEDIIKAYYFKTKFWKDWWSETNQENREQEVERSRMMTNGRKFLEERQMWQDL